MHVVLSLTLWAVPGPVDKAAHACAWGRMTGASPAHLLIRASFTSCVSPRGLLHATDAGMRALVYGNRRAWCRQRTEKKL